MIIFCLLIIMTVIGSSASLFLKKASDSKKVIDLLKNKNIYIGGILYLISAILNIFILKYLPYSVVLPMTSITYVWTLIFSNRFLGESIGKRKAIGVICIFVGAICIAV